MACLFVLFSLLILMCLFVVRFCWFLQNVMLMRSPLLAALTGLLVSVHLSTSSGNDDNDNGVCPAEGCPDDQARPLVVSADGAGAGRLYRRLPLDDQWFTDHVVFTASVATRGACAALCGLNEACLTFTFPDGEGRCRGHGKVSLERVGVVGMVLFAGQWGLVSRLGHLAHCTLYLVPCAFHIVHSSLYFAPRSLYLAPCTLCTVPYTLCVAPCTLFLVPSTLHLAPCTLYLVPCTLYLVPCTLYYLPCPLCLSHCTLFFVPCTLYLAPCTKYLVPCTFCLLSLHLYLTGGHHRVIASGSRGSHVLHESYHW